MPRHAVSQPPGTYYTWEGMLVPSVLKKTTRHLLQKVDWTMYTQTYKTAGQLHKTQPPPPPNTKHKTPHTSKQNRHHVPPKQGLPADRHLQQLRMGPQGPRLARRPPLRKHPRRRLRPRRRPLLLGDVVRRLPRLPRPRPRHRRAAPRPPRPPPGRPARPQGRPRPRRPPPLPAQDPLHRQGPAPPDPSQQVPRRPPARAGPRHLHRREPQARDRRRPRPL
ncbi:hypothetical protein LZ30DRAFT_710586 [Colletotrichum cereale]|nr:hypothetical protein LZ30DRAFT_710586 [Colletotrichum cereale]